MNMVDLKVEGKMQKELTLETPDKSMAQRATNVLNLVPIMPVINVSMIITTLAFYFIQRSWQHLAMTGLVIVSGITSIFALNAAKRGKISLAANITLGTVLLYFPFSPLFWSGATIVYSLGIIAFVNAISQLILLKQERSWVSVLSLIMAALPILFDNIPLPWQRFDVTQWVFTSIVVYVLLGSSIVLGIWRLVIAYQSIRTIAVRLGMTLAIGGILVALIIGLASTAIGYRITQNQAFDQLNIVTDLREERVSIWIDTIQMDLDALFAETYQDEGVDLLIQEILAGENHQDVNPTLSQRFNGVIERTGRYEEILLLNLNGEVAHSTNLENVAKVYTTQSFFINGLERKYVDQPRYVPELQRMSFIVSRPVYDSSHQVIGVVAARVRMDQLTEIVAGGVVEESGVSYLVADNFALLSSLPDISEGDSVISYGIGRAIHRVRSSGIYQDYRNVKVLGVYRWLPKMRTALITEVERREILAISLPAIFVNLGAATFSAILSVLLSIWIARGITNRLGVFADIATRIAQGESELSVPITEEDEISALARAFNSMTGQLKISVNELEQRVAERTQGLLVTADVSRVTTSELDPEKLMPQIVNLVNEQFHLYYVGLFIAEETDEGYFAVLRAGTGEVGRQMLAQGWRLEVGGESMIGQCISTGLSRVKQNEREIVPRFQNTLLPATRSELALPLRYGPRVIGAMTVQSELEAAFDETTITLLQNMADQVAVAVENARLFAETQAALDRANLIQQRYQGQAWREYISDQSIRGYEKDADSFSPLGLELLPEVEKAITSHQPVVDDNGVLTVPVIQSGQVVGVLGFEKSDKENRWSDEQITLIRSLSEQLALAAENQRLLEDTQTRVSREQLTREITDQIRSTLDVDTILTTAVREIGQVMGLEDLTIELHDVGATPVK